MKTLETKKAPAAIGPYSQAKMTGNFLFASGQIPVDPATGEVAGDKIETQAEQSCKNVGAILEEAGLTFDNVIKTTCFPQRSLRGQLFPWFLPPQLLLWRVSHTGCRSESDLGPCICIQSFLLFCSLILFLSFNFCIPFPVCRLPEMCLKIPSTRNDFSNTL